METAMMLVSVPIKCSVMMIAYMLLIRLLGEFLAKLLLEMLMKKCKLSIF